MVREEGGGNSQLTQKRDNLCPPTDGPLYKPPPLEERQSKSIQPGSLLYLSQETSRYLLSPQCKSSLLIDLLTGVALISRRTMQRQSTGQMKNSHMNKKFDTAHYAFNSNGI